MVWFLTLGSIRLLKDDITDTKSAIGVDTSRWPDVKGIAAEVQKREQIKFE